MGGNYWLDTGLPVSGIYTYQSTDRHFYLHICEMTEYGIRIASEYFFCTGKHVTAEFMGKTYSPWEEYELIKLHDALETELALAKLEG